MKDARINFLLRLAVESGCYLISLVPHNPRDLDDDERT
jgi:hypothetical protein